MLQIPCAGMDSFKATIESWLVITAAITKREEETGCR